MSTGVGAGRAATSGRPGGGPAEGASSVVPSSTKTRPVARETSASAAASIAGPLGGCAVRAHHVVDRLAGVEGHRAAAAVGPLVQEGVAALPGRAPCAGRPSGSPARGAATQSRRARPRRAARYRRLRRAPGGDAGAGPARAGCRRRPSRAGRGRRRCGRRGRRARRPRPRDGRRRPRRRGRARPRSRGSHRPGRPRPPAKTRQTAAAAAARGRKCTRTGAAQSAISQSTAPLVTTCPVSAVRPVTVPALWAVMRLLHLHRLEHDDEVAGLDDGAVLDGDLDDRALHRRGEAVAGRRGGRRLASSSAWRGGLLGRRRRRAEPGGQRHLQPASADLDDDGLARLGVVLGRAPRRRTAAARCRTRSRSSGCARGTARS